MRNIRHALEKNNIEFSSIRNPKGRIIVSTEDEGALTPLKNIFGISSISVAREAPLDIERIKEEALSLYRDRASSDETFRISTQRLNKEFPLTSQEVNAQVGSHVAENAHARVQLEGPDIDIGIEILPKAAYLFTGRVPAFGGLPVGVQGRVLVCLTDRKSAVAAWMMLKRGCELVAYGNAALLPYLEAFSYGHPIEYVSNQERAKNCLAAVFPEFILEKRKAPSFYPLLGLTEEQIQDIENLIFPE